MRRSHWPAAIAAAVLLACVAWLTWFVVTGQCATFDAHERAQIHAESVPALTRSMRVITWAGSPEFVWPVAVGIALWFSRDLGHSIIPLLLGPLMGAAGTGAMIKLAVHRARPAPFFGYPKPDTWSFPSGHALTSMCFYVTLAVVLGMHVRSAAIRVLMIVVAVVLALAIGFSRVYLGVHYPSDVLCGFAIGLLWVAVMVAMKNRRLARRG